MFDLLYFTHKAAAHPDGFFIAGCDEVGRGPLAGPVVAACASIEIKNFDIKEIRSLLRTWSKFGITDSKKITAKNRVEILKKISTDTGLSLHVFQQIQLKLIKFFQSFIQKTFKSKFSLKKFKQLRSMK